MKSHWLTSSLAIFAAITSITTAANEGDPYAHESPAERDARMAWWREAKFGMFIHWGVYAVPAGNFDGKPIGGIGEWIMRNGKIPVTRYRAYAAQFNPVKYNPEAWAALAKEAGMRYLVITSKHHDGFTLFPSAASQWNIADATPWKQDLIAPLAKAARQQGLKFGLYYSQAQDWTNPGGAKSGYPDGGGWDDLQKGRFDTYIDQVAVPQVREILTRYQPDVLWWDTPHLMNDQRAAKIAALLSLKPGIIHNNRLGGSYKGDTETPEQHIPATGYPGRDWETCMTMNDTWGYKRDDHHWKPLSTLITNLVDIASKGGNYLLNVGPTADGEIPDESITRLKQVGAWMKINGESIYGSHASPFKKLSWGRCTSKPAGEQTILYLHVLKWPTDGKLLVPGLSNPVNSVVLLDGGAQVKATASADGPILTLPNNAPDPICSTLKMVIQGKPNVVEPAIAPDQDGIIRLLPADAQTDGTLIKTENHGGLDNLGYWTRSKDSVCWSLRATHEGKYLVKIETATTSQGSVLQLEGAGKLACAIPKTKDYQDFTTTKLGVITLTANPTTLTLRPVPDGWSPVNVRKIELIPQP